MEEERRKNMKWKKKEDIEKEEKRGNGKRKNCER